MTANKPDKVPTNSPALIPFEEDEIDSPTPVEEIIQPVAAQRRYNLWERATHIINSVIIEETPNVTSSKLPPKHIGQYSEAIQHLLHTEHASDQIFAGAVIDPDTGKMLEYRDLIRHEKYKEVWIRAFTKELDQLAQGKCGYNGTNTIFFVNKSDIPKRRRATYGRIVCDYHPQKQDPNKVRLTVG
eukprot:13989633-Ditylum_brightwellii.AAC.1